MISVHLFVTLLKAMLFLIAFSLLVAIPGMIWEYFRCKRLARKRSGLSICQFVRSLEYRRIDRRIIRTAYEGVQGWTLPGINNFPVMASDDIYKIYRVDVEDLEVFAELLAEKARRSWKSKESNPLYGKVFTVKELILFLNKQPELST